MILKKLFYNAYVRFIKNGFKVGRSAGAMARRFYVDTSKSEKYIFKHDYDFHIKDGTFVTEKIIAQGKAGGRFAKKGIEDIERLVKKYKLPNKNLTSEQAWCKVVGKAIITNGVATWLVDLHWYQCKDIGKVEFKVKKWLRKL